MITCSVLQKFYLNRIYIHLFDNYTSGKYIKITIDISNSNFPLFEDLIVVVVVVVMRAVIVVVVVVVIVVIILWEVVFFVIIVFVVVLMMSTVRVSSIFVYHRGIQSSTILSI